MAQPKDEWSQLSFEYWIGYVEERFGPLRAHIFKHVAYELQKGSSIAYDKSSIALLLACHDITYKHEELDYEIAVIRAYAEEHCKANLQDSTKPYSYDDCLEHESADLIREFNEAYDEVLAGDAAIAAGQKPIVAATRAQLLAEFGEEGLKAIDDTIQAPPEEFVQDWDAEPESSPEEKQPLIAIDKNKSLEEVQDILNQNPYSLPPIVEQGSETAQADRLHSYGHFYFAALPNGPARLGGVMKARGCTATTTLRVENVVRDPKLVIRIQCSDVKGKLLRIASAEFELGSHESRGIKPDINIRFVDSKDTPNPVLRSITGRTDYYAAKYHKVSVSGTGNLESSNVPKELHAIFETLGKLKSPEAGEKDVALYFYLNAFNDEKLRFLDDIKRAIVDHAYPLSMHAYNPDNSAFIPGVFHNLATREQVFEGSGDRIASFGPRNSYRNANYAVLVQNHGHKNEHSFNEARKNLFNEAIHGAAFQIVNETHGKLYLRADTSKLKGPIVGNGTEAAVSSPMSTEELIVRANVLGEWRKFQGRLIHNPDHKVEATFQIHLSSIPTDFRKFAQYFGEELNWWPASATTNLDTKTVKRQLDGNMTFWTYSQYKNLSDTASGLRLHEVENVNPAEHLKKSPEETAQMTEQIVANVTGLFTWNEEQLKIIQNTFSVPGGWGIISAPGGSGKTECDAGLAVGYLISGLHVIGMAQTNSATDTLHSKISTMCQLAGLEVPPRMYSESQEIDWLMNQGKEMLKPTGKNFHIILKDLQSAYLQEIDALDKIKQKQKHHRFAHPSSSAAEALLREYIDTGKKLLVSAKPDKGGRDEQDVEYFEENGTQYKEIAKTSQPNANMIDGVAEYYRLQEMHDENGVLSKEDRNELRYYCTKLLRAFIATKRCLVTTIHNSWTHIPRNSFATKSRGLVFIVDEASCVAEIEINAAVTKLVPMPRLLREYKGASLVKAIWLSGDPKQLGNFALNLSHNEFREQIQLDYISRLTDVGHKVFKLRIQHRFHEVLLDRLINKTIYDGILIPGPGTSASLESRKFNDAQVKFLMKYFEVKTTGMAKLDSPEVQKIKLEKDLHFRFIDAHGSSEGTTVSGSKLNLGNLAVYKEFVLEAFLRKQLFKPSDFAFLSPYFGQIQACEVMISGLLHEWNQKLENENDKIMTIADIPQMIVADSAQSREFKHVWYDTVTTRKEGFLVDDRRGHSHLTRGKNSIWIVGHLRMWLKHGKSKNRTNATVNFRGEPKHSFSFLKRAVHQTVGLRTTKIAPAFNEPHHLAKLNHYPHPSSKVTNEQESGNDAQNQDD